MRSPSVWLLAGACVLTACFGQPEEPVRPVPDPSLTQPPQEAPEVSLTSEVENARDALIRYANAGSLRGLSRTAAETDNFLSNFGGQDHLEFWNLMRRIGIDPNVKLRELFQLPVGVREVDGERWYVWPDLAARDAADLIPEKLTFKERARLKALIGEEGIARIRAGEGYPGMRTAIADDGRWIYFVLGADAEE